MIEAQTAGKSKTPAPVQATVGAAPAQYPATNGKPAWPLRNITRGAAVEIVGIIAPKLKTQMTLDEIAVNCGLDVDHVSKVYDTFKSDIDKANSYGGNTAEIFKQAMVRRYGN